MPAGDGPVELVEVQPEGKGRMAAVGLGQRRPLAARRSAPLMSDAPRARSRAATRSAASRTTAPTPTSLLPELLARSGLADRDRHFATELVYGTTRMRRACDLLVDRFLTRDVEPAVARALRLGAYQLHFLGMAPHAAVGETVEVAPRRARGLVNAVLRKVSDQRRWSGPTTPPA